MDRRWTSLKASRNESIASCKQQLRMTTGNLIPSVIFPFGPLT
jgi:hypothetical protein